MNAFATPIPVESISACGIPQFSTDDAAEDYVNLIPTATAEVVHRGVVVSIYFGREAKR